jgi:hypothetical protein
MADTPRDADSGQEHDGLPPRMPLWVKVFGLVLGVLVIAVVVVLLVAGGEHGPGRHLPGGHGHPVDASREATS